MALGSSRLHVLKTVLWDAVKLALPGMACGSVVGVFVARGVLNRMYVNIGLPMADTRILGFAAFAALAVVLLASLSPAGRAARIDPMEALRAE